MLVLALELDALVVPEPAERRVDLLRQHGRDEVEPDVDLLHAADTRVLGDRHFVFFAFQKRFQKRRFVRVVFDDQNAMDNCRCEARINIAFRTH